MKDKNIIKHARKYFAWWSKWLGLNYGKVNLVFVDYIKDAGDTYINIGVAGKCEADWRYQESYVYLALNVLRDMDKHDIELVVVHELMHVMLNEMREEGIDHEERVATNLQKAFFWVRDGVREEDNA